MNRRLFTIVALGAAGSGAANTASSTDTATLQTNKKVVLDFWRNVFDAQDVAKAKIYLSEDYRQHNPNVTSGLKGFEQFFGAMWPHPKAPSEVKPTHFEVVLAEEDLVQLMFERTMASISRSLRRA